jgi:import inner membrane translocase subunit TIM17
MSSGSFLERDPCPDRILDDAGGAFGMGLVGGSAFHFLKGLYNSPNGARIVGGMQAARMNAPRLGGSFAVWGTLFSTFDCTAVYVRQKEDPWNSIIAGASTSGLLSLRKGLRSTVGGAIVGAAFLAGIEGAGIVINTFLAKQQNTPPLPADDPNVTIATGLPQAHESYTDLSSSSSSFPGLPQLPVYPPEVASSSVSGSWFGSLFGKEKKKASSSRGTSEILESFDTPSPPIPSFDYK